MCKSEWQAVGLRMHSGNILESHKFRPYSLTVTIMRWDGHSDIGDLVANWPHLFKVKNLYLVGMLILLDVLVSYVERSCEVWPRRNQ